MLRPFYKKKRYLIPFIFIVFILGSIVYFRAAVVLNPPAITDFSSLKLKRDKIGNDFYVLKDSWFKKNKYGLWELYLTGNDFELGAKNGILTKEIIEYQEVAFVERIQEMVLSKSYLNFLKYFIAWFNKDIDKHVPFEYQKEIYGVSFSASSKFDFIAPNYHRMLNYHAAHDIGHTLQNMNMVACTAFGVKDSRSEDGSLLVGRNMDFYSGDKFAENKIIAFFKPGKGNNFAFITWGGLIGVISGMNDKGLVVTLNAAKSTIPYSAKTPVSILARKILQYASTIDEAYKIAKSYNTFVAESFLIASAKDRQIAVIEKSPDTIGIYRRNDDEMILTNHFQSETFKNSALTIESKNESASGYRWERTNELLKQTEKHNVNSFAAILRDQRGMGGKDIGMGNEKAINQLIAHHSIIFKPEQLQFWISTYPYQLGEYLEYDLNKIFSGSLDFHKNVYDSSLTIKADTFLYSTDYQNFIKYKETTKQIEARIKETPIKEFDKGFIDTFLKFNPEYYYTYFILGEYYKKTNNKTEALKYYKLALQKEIPIKKEAGRISKSIDLLNESK